MEVPGQEDKEKFWSNEHSHLNWDWSLHNEKGFGKECWGILSFEFTQSNIKSLSCHSSFGWWVLYAYANHSRCLISCTNHPMSAPVTASPSCLVHTWHTWSLSAAEEVLRLLSWSSYVILTACSSIWRSPGQIRSRKLESMAGHL
jgi:hypothetical protein